MNTAENEFLTWDSGFTAEESESMMVSQTKSLTAHLTLRSKWNLSALKVRRQ